MLSLLTDRSAVMAEEIKDALIGIGVLGFDWDRRGALSQRPDAVSFAMAMTETLGMPPRKPTYSLSTTHVQVIAGIDGCPTVEFSNRANHRRLAFLFHDGQVVRVERYITPMSSVRYQLTWLEIEKGVINPLVELFDWLTAPVPAHRRALS